MITKKKKVLAKRKAPAKQKAKVEILPERIVVPQGPLFGLDSKALLEFTNNPTRGAIDATYAFLFKKMRKGSPVLARFQAPLTMEGKLEAIRRVLDRNGLLPEGMR